MSSYTFNLGQIFRSTVLGQIDHDSQNGNAAQTPIRGKPKISQKRKTRKFV
jgi:hypothetical protein